MAKTTAKTVKTKTGKTSGSAVKKAGGTRSVVKASKKTVAKNTAGAKKNARTSSGKAARTPVKKASKKTTAKKTVPRKISAKKAGAKKTNAPKTARRAGAGKKTATGKKTTRTTARTPARKTTPAKVASTPAKKRAATTSRPRAVAKIKSKPRISSAEASAVERQTATAKSRRTKPAGESRHETIPPNQGLFGVPGLLPHERGNADPADGGHPPGASQDGYQSEDARHSAHQRHLQESHVTAIHGHIASTDRRNQGKRDHRGEN